MKQKYLLFWITSAGVVGILFGVFYTVFGLEGLPVYQLFVPASSFAGWSKGVYGATFIGFSMVILLLGRHAIRKNDNELKQILLEGITIWLLVEAAISLFYGVYINVGVDAILLAFLSFPLRKKSDKSKEGQS